MAVTSLPDLTNLIYTGIDVVFDKALKAPRETYYKNIVTEKNIDKKYGWYETVGTLGAAAEVPEAQTIQFQKVEDGNKTTIETKKYGIGAQASLEALKFDLYGVVEKNFGDPLVTRLIQNKEEIVAGKYNNAFTDTGADGVAIISDSHPLINSALVNDNLITGSLTPENLVKAKNMFHEIKDHGGKRYYTRPTHLLIHPAKKFTALQILNSALMALELSNTKNTVQDIMPVAILENPYLTYNYTTEKGPWFLLDKTLTDAGCILQKNGGVELEKWWDHSNKTYKATAIEFFGVGFTSPGFGVVASQDS